MRRVRLGSESGRIWAGMGGVLLMAAGAAVVAMVAFATDSPAGRVPVAQADHNTVSEEELEELPNGTKVLICHTEGNGSQHTIDIAVEALIQAGHFDAPGNPEHAVGDVHDFIISIEGQDPINDEECGVVATATQPVATATSAITPEATNTPPVATATSAITPEATNTSVPPTNTAVPPTNTPESTATPTETPPATLTIVELATEPTATPVTAVQAAQATPPPGLPPAAPLDVPATPAPAVTTLPATGSGGYEDSSLTLIIGIAMILAGTSVSLIAIKRRA